MRFDLLLAQYLYQHKKLNLPGIGTFEADSSVYADEYDKQKQAMEGITFINTTIVKADDGLIDYIKEQTGKMKPLAISDLESYLTLGKQFLYIGKPFYLEGIGTLQLAKDGRFEFIPGEYITTKLEDPNIERSEGKTRSVHEENRIKQESNTNNLKKFLLVLLILGGIALVGWGGYYFYNMYINQQSQIMEDSADLKRDAATSALSLEDSILSASGAKDTSAINPLTESNASTTGFYKFIIETTNDKTRALKRYYSLRSFGNKVTLQTKDSINYKIFYNLPATPSDTLRIRDSLNLVYFKSESPVRIRIEQ
ncbi:MAG: hypothetical protein ABIN89_27850 [Chitinophagaceae bacterium]